MSEALADWESILAEEVQEEIREAWVREREEKSRANSQWDRDFEEKLIHEAETEGVTGMDLFGAEWVQDEIRSVRRQAKSKHWTELIEVIALYSLFCSAILIALCP